MSNCLQNVAQFTTTGLMSLQKKAGKFTPIAQGLHLQLIDAPPLKASLLARVLIS
jgi:hypothetical protein